MGMGMAPASCWTISSDNLKKIVPKEYKNFMKAVEGSGASLEHIAMRYSQEFEVELTLEQEFAIDLTYNELRDAFEKKTKLTINIQFHDSSNDGDRYDDVDGVFWELEGVTKMTPAGEKMLKKNLIQYSRWCMFG